MEITLSSTNPTKAVQIREGLKGLPITIKTLREAGIKGEGNEDSDSILENARSKGRFGWAESPRGIWSLAEDTQFCIRYLNSAPGAKAARWAGDVSTEEIMGYTLNRMRNASDRFCYFECVFILISPTGAEHQFWGIVNGNLLEAPRTKPQPKMPYSPIFVPEGHTKCWAEMDVDEENLISHRGQALRELRKFLEMELNRKPA